MTNEELDKVRKMIGEEIQSRRIFLKLSQADLGEKVGMHNTTISKIEKGDFWMNMKQYIQLLDALGMERLEPIWINI